MRHTKRAYVLATATGFMASLLALGGAASPVGAAQPGPVFVNGSVGPKVSAGQLILPRPTGTSAGDVLIVGVAEHEVGTAAAPAGWKLIRQDKASADVWLWVYYRVAGASEPPRYVWKVGDGAANGAILTYRGVDGGNPVVASAGAADVSGTTAAIQVPSMNVGPVSPTMLVMFAMVEGPTPNPITPPAGFTERTERGVHPSTESSDMVFAGTGKTGARSAKAKVGGGNVGHIGTIVALRPAGSPQRAPGAPSGVLATAGDGNATVSWSPPTDQGDTPLTGYRVNAYQGASEVATVTTPDGTGTSAVLANLADGVTYTFTVAALNSRGAGPTSAPSAPVTPGAATSNPKHQPPRPPSQSDRHGGRGYWMIGSGGAVYAFGEARHLGDPSTQLGSSLAVDLEPTPSSEGYWVLDDAGRVYAFGDARDLGDVDHSRLAPGETVTSLSATPDGDGYWVFTNRGRVLTFGDAPFFGDLAHLTLNGPVLESIPTPAGLGYYMVASDGGVFAFGDARFYGSVADVRLNAPVQSLVPDPDGVGYWLVASDGGVFAFDAPFRGSMGGKALNKPVTGMVPFGNGYLMVGEDGGIFDFSDRPFLGSLGGQAVPRSIAAVAVAD